jgi:molybdopterin-guanine dinucleotide biosynthesis protein MobB
MDMIEKLPVLGICGYKGAGKTTVIERLIPLLADRGLNVAVIKHDVHGVRVDAKGTDSDRLYQAGADILIRGPEQGFFRMRQASRLDLREVLRFLAPCYDLILVEGHKSTPLPNKVWLRRNSLDLCPSEVSGIKVELDRDVDRAGTVSKLLDTLLHDAQLKTEVYAGLLIGGKSSRMGRPKHLIRENGHAWLELTVGAVAPFVDDVIILGSARVPESLEGLTVLPDISDVEGPLAGMLSAMRWQPWASWLFVACDLPFISTQAVKWLLATRLPGVWATLPRLPAGGGVEPLFAHYDYRSRLLLEGLRRPADITVSPKVITPTPPEDIAVAWSNINTPQDIGRLAECGQVLQSKEVPD